MIGVCGVCVCMGVWCMRMHGVCGVCVCLVCVVCAYVWSVVCVHGLCVCMVCVVCAYAWSMWFVQMCVWSVRMHGVCVCTV